MFWYYILQDEYPPNTSRKFKKVFENASGVLFSITGTHDFNIIQWLPFLRHSIEHNWPKLYIEPSCLATRTWSCHNNFALYISGSSSTRSFHILTDVHNRRFPRSSGSGDSKVNNVKTIYQRSTDPIITSTHTVFHRNFSPKRPKKSINRIIFANKGRLNTKNTGWW